MFTLRVTTTFAAPIERCFDLARNVEAHLKSAAHTGETAVAGRTRGLLELGDEVTWEARHFGVRQRLMIRITAFERPRYFQDRMIRGAFKFLEHDHHFESGDGGTTVMTDIVRFQAPLGPLGWLAERLFLAGHVRRFVEVRGVALKAMAESESG
jgi:ligand-binding SRPBCC domain-containing protein